MGDATVTVTGTTSQIGYALVSAAAVSFHTDTMAPTRAFRPYPRSAVWSTGVAAAQPGWECCRPVARAGGKHGPAFLTGCAETQVGWAVTGGRRSGRLPGWPAADGCASAMTATASGSSPLPC